MNTRSSPSRNTLNRLAERAGIEGYETLPKSALYERLTEKYNYDRLMRAEARTRANNGLKSKSKTSRKRSSSLVREEEEDEKKNTNTTCSSTSSAPPAPTANSATKAKKVKLNPLDPIMFVPIEKKKKPFVFHRPNGSCIQFNVSTLIDYLLTSGDFHDPETRLPFSDEELKEIDSLAVENGLTGKPSVYNAKKNEHFYKEMKFRRDALLGLERCAGEVITEILELIEESDPEEAQMQFAMKEFPTFLDYFKQIHDFDREYASKCIAHWKLFIVGPPNNRNDDGSTGLMRMVLDFLKNCGEGRF